MHSTAGFGESARSGGAVAVRRVRAMLGFSLSLPRAATIPERRLGQSTPYAIVYSHVLPEQRAQVDVALLYSEHLASLLKHYCEEYYFAKYLQGKLRAFLVQFYFQLFLLRPQRHYSLSNPNVTRDRAWYAGTKVGQAKVPGPPKKTGRGAKPKSKSIPLSEAFGGLIDHVARQRQHRVRPEPADVDIDQLSRELEAFDQCWVERQSAPTLMAACTSSPIHIVTPPTAAASSSGAGASSSAAAATSSSSKRRAPNQAAIDEAAPTPQSTPTTTPRIAKRRKNQPPAEPTHVPAPAGSPPATPPEPRARTRTPHRTPRSSPLLTPQASPPGSPGDYLQSSLPIGEGDEANRNRTPRASPRSSPRTSPRTPPRPSPKQSPLPSPKQGPGRNARRPIPARPGNWQICTIPLPRPCKHCGTLIPSRGWSERCEACRDVVCCIPCRKAVIAAGGCSCFSARTTPVISLDAAIPAAPAPTTPPADHTTDNATYQQQDGFIRPLTDEPANFTEDMAKQCARLGAGIIKKPMPPIWHRMPPQLEIRVLEVVRDAVLLHVEAEIVAARTPNDNHQSYAYSYGIFLYTCYACIMFKPEVEPGTAQTEHEADGVHSTGTLEGGRT